MEVKPPQGSHFQGRGVWIRNARQREEKYKRNTETQDKIRRAVQ